MSQTSAIASGPISYFTSSGQRLVIPAGIIAFNNGAVSIVAGNPTYDTPEIKAWLERLHQAGFLREGSAPAVQPALNMTAANSGAWGNDMVATVTYSDATTFDMTVTVTNTYKGLTTGTLKGVLGASATTGSRPGLVYVSSSGTPSVPNATVTPTPFTLGAAGPPAVAAKADIAPSAAFTLTARVAGAAGNKLTASVSDLVTDADPTKSTFTLTVVWQDTLASQSTSNLTTMASNINTTFGYVLTISAPAGGYAAPSAGTYVLKGGADIATAAGIVFSKS
ncbi:MAG: hypothetical protein QM820_35245 [Minicystis sp.]